MCGHCRAHREFLEELNFLLDKLPAVPRGIKWDDMARGHYLNLVEIIPQCLPDGTGIFTPEGWVRWAKKKLGYDAKD